MSESSVIIHKCPNCDGPLMFDPKNQKFQCEYCGSTFTDTEVSDFEQAQKERSGVTDETTSQTEPIAQSKSDDGQVDVGLFVCPTCGAEIVTDATTAATTCYYCHNPVVLSDRISGKYLPEVVLPFQIERKEAEEKFIQWTGKKKFIPTAFFDKKQISNLQGVYFPYWVVDSELNGQMSAQATNIRVWRIGDIEYTETKQYSIFRKGITSFKDLTKNALKKNEAEKMVATVQPFDLSKAVPFKNQYLSGFLAEKRDIEFQEMKGAVDKELGNYAEDLMRQTITGYMSVTNVQSSQSIASQNSRYVLLPIWLVTYREKVGGKLFYYAMNGQTGKVAGILPVSKKKLALTAMVMFAALAIIGVIAGWFLS